MSKMSMYEAAMIVHEGLFEKFKENLLSIMESKFDEFKNWMIQHPDDAAKVFGNNFTKLQTVQASLLPVRFVELQEWMVYQYSVRVSSPTDLLLLDIFGQDLCRLAFTTNNAFQVLLYLHAESTRVLVDTAQIFRK